MSDRIVFNTATPNNQGFKVPNDVLKFDRYVKNPVLLYNHDWDKLPIGKMTDVRFESGEWTGIPVFHRLTTESREVSDLYDAGFLKACSMGGFKELKTTGKTVRDKDGNTFPEVWLDKDGNGQATEFDVYEISIVPIPSNADAVTKETLLAAKVYDSINLNALQTQITTLSTKLQNMETEAEKATRLKAEAEQADALKATQDAKALEEAEAAKLAGRKADELPPVIADAVKADEAKKKAGLAGTIADMFAAAVVALTGMSNDAPKVNVLAAPTPQNLPSTTGGSDAENKLFDKLMEKVGTMKAKKLEEAQLKATELATDALAAKDKADKADATDEDKKAFESAKMAADKAITLCAKLEADMDDDEGDSEMKAKKEKAAMAAKQPLKLKTMDELKADQTKLAAVPNHGNRVNITGLPTTMSKLAADAQGKKIIDRVTNRAEGTDVAEYAVYMNALRNEPKYKELFDKVRIVLGATEGNYKTYRQSSRSEPGVGVDVIIAKLASGRASWLDKSTGQMTDRTTLTATDNFLASPDLQAMDFLDLAIFKLFPTTSWKDSIPLFGAQTTENNTGLIWANIAANPAIYMGSQPVNPANYTYQDTPVALNLTPFWMQPMLWNPLAMAQLRYDQMGTGWAQAFAVMGTFIDDFLLYTLASAVPHKSIVYSSGISPNPNGGNTGVQQFTLNGNADNPYSFYYVPTFQGSLNNPTLNDIITTELIYNKQNYELENESAVMVMDPTTDALISSTSQSQSLLTKWTQDNGRDQLGFKHTRFNQRSRVIAFDPTTAQVKSPFSIIPSTATSANLGFIPSQVGIGIGNLDVFMIQDPGQYGYKMSADVRMGITPLRADGSGINILAYGPGIIS